jgi:protocatechuate 3,4-dioxygenase beta subunit
MMQRRFEGRPLPRPGQELVDQGLGFDLATLLSRRRMLQALSLGIAGAGLAACGADHDPVPAPSSPGTVAGEIPEETAGPFPGNGSNGPDVLEQSGVVRGDIRSSFAGASGTAEGVLLTLDLTIVDLANGARPFTGVAVYVWHCDREGRYSMYSSGVTDQNYLRGVQVADAAGRVRFTSIFPGCYAGRWPHVHFEVYPDVSAITESTKTIATSQLAFPKDVCDAVYARPGYEQSGRNIAGLNLATDNVFADDGGSQQLATMTGDVGSGYTAALSIGVDTRTPSRGRR